MSYTHKSFAEIIGLTRIINDHARNGIECFNNLFRDFDTTVYFLGNLSKRCHSTIAFNN
ncbi:hypothetical protein N826_34275 [Skermanella aerolata KACC 11604]|nr:hypothetical protein N826_34275 [Skermanella aerolata KACC 11604]